MAAGNSAHVIELQQAMQQCDSKLALKGRSNASVTREEDPESFAKIVGRATDAEGVESSIASLLAGM